MEETTNNIAILGSGNIGMSLAKGLVKSGYCRAEKITLTRRNLQKVSEQMEQGFQVTDQNFEVVAASSIIVIAVLPQQLNGLLDQIAGAINPENHLIISVVSGVSCADIRAKLGANVQVVRAMPNTAIAIRQSMTCIASDNTSSENLN